MAYYESAKGTTITRKRALKELDKHGVLCDSESFYRDLGLKETYNAQDVLNWLGY
jgi:hypothetical protein